MTIATLVAPYLAGVTAMAALIIPITTFVRKHIFTRMDGWEVVGFAVILGNAFAFAGFFAHLVTWSIVGTLVFGTFTGLYSAGLVATLKGGAKTITVVLMRFLEELLPPNTAPTNSGDSGKPPVAPTTPSTPSPTP